MTNYTKVLNPYIYTCNSLFFLFSFTSSFISLFISLLNSFYFLSPCQGGYYFPCYATENNYCIFVYCFNYNNCNYIINRHEIGGQISTNLRNYWKIHKNNTLYKIVSKHFFNTEIHVSIDVTYVGGFESCHLLRPI